MARCSIYVSDDVADDTQALSRVLSANVLRRHMTNSRFRRARAGRRVEITSRVAEPDVDASAPCPAFEAVHLNIRKGGAT